MYLKVILQIGILDYKCPECLLSLAMPFKRVVVPLSNRKVIGLIYEISDHTCLINSQVKEIFEILDEHPLITPITIQLLLWAHNYYKGSLYELCILFIPVHYFKNKQLLPEPDFFYSANATNIYNSKQLKAKLTSSQTSCLDVIKSSDRGLLASKRFLYKISASTLQSLVNSGHIYKASIGFAKSNIISPHILNEQQNAAVTTIKSLKDFQVFLLYGITGSGKTEVYCQVIESLLADKGQILILVPEIHLTYAMKAYFEKRFAVIVAIIHSSVGSNKASICESVRAGLYQIIITTRIGVFLDAPNLKMIIVDEEHDLSFKNTTKISYNAKHIAIKKAQLNNISIILGSATPSLTSYHAAISGKYTLIQLKNKALTKINSKYHIIDMSKEKITFGMSNSLLSNLTIALNDNRQAILYYNRVGYANIIECTKCRMAAICSKCNHNLILINSPYTYLNCRICNYKKEINYICSNCSGVMVAKGLGTEKIENDIKILFPEHNILRMDSFTKENFPSYFVKIEKQEVHIIIGTQILAKGYDFSNIGFVGIINTDMGLYSKDWSAFEATCQLIYQVAGRAGRQGNMSHIYLQTHNPQHVIFNMLIKGDYTSILDYMLTIRQNNALPPFIKQIYLYGEHVEKQHCFNVLTDIYHALCLYKTSKHLNCEIGQVIPCLQEKMNNMYKYMIILKSNSMQALNDISKIVSIYRKKIGVRDNIKLYLDVDPLFMQ